MPRKPTTPGPTQPQTDSLFDFPAVPEFNAFPQELVDRVVCPAAPTQTGKPEAKRTPARADASDQGQEAAAARGAGNAAKTRPGPREPTPASEARPETLAGEAAERPEQERTHESAEALPRLGMRPRSLTPAQRAVLTHLQRTGSCITTYRYLSDALGVPVPTLRDVLRKFAALGWIRKQKYARGPEQGLEIRVLEAMDAARAVSGGLARQGRRATGPAALTAKDVALRWPSLAQVGFTVRRLRQALAHLRKTGRTDAFVTRGLDHAEWERARGQGPDLESLFRALAASGYYPKPRGYTDPEELARLENADQV